jgi:asparagine synthase (glutamine-hydrolysing)
VLRYIIVIGDPRSPSDARSMNEVRRRHQSSSMAWRSAGDHPGFYAAYIDGEPFTNSAILLQNQRGVIFGQVFGSTDGSDGSPSEPVRGLSRNASEEIIQSMGQSLISRCWGYYVAVLRYPDRPSARVLRGPVSPLACFHMKVGTLNVFFSYLEDCAALKLAALSINWDSIAAQVVGGDYLTDETAINEITTLECGEGVDCTPGGYTKHVYWDPGRFLKDRSLSSFADATRALRGTVDHCVNAQSLEHNRILVNLSGGLDSSIVLSALARAPHKPLLTAVNYHSRGCGDERPYARPMARSVNCRLVEYARNDRLDLRCFYDCNLTVRPVLNYSAPDVEARNTTLARDSNATAIFNGELGDNIFGRNPGAGILLEYIRLNGIGPRFLSVATDYAMLTKQSLWRTLALTRQESKSLTEYGTFSALRKLQGRYGVEGASSMSLASTDAEKHYCKIADRFLHPWLKQARELAPDSHKLLFGLIAVTSTAYHSPFAAPDDPQPVSPFVSQPLAEVALRIPGYLHCSSAQDRAVARAAFAGRLPAEVLNRGLGKGGPGTWAKDVVENNSKFLRDFLLDGTLVQRGLLDQKKLETALSPRIAKSTAMVGDIFAKLYIEAWVRNFARLETPRN